MGILLGFSGYTPILAHFGHWYVSLPVFGAPVVIIAVAVKLSERRERRRVRSGDTGAMRVISEQEGNRAVVRVRGSLDYPTLLDIERELERVAVGASHIVLVLSELEEIEDERFAWDLAEVVGRVAGAEVTVLIGDAPELEELRKVSALEGLKLATGDSATG